ncbi:MAG: hypothetical protein Q7J85_08795 [Bacillota bacterium]|nr:hypothetical protein [Bacillota bacterium]
MSNLILCFFERGKAMRKLLLLLLIISFVFASSGCSVLEEREAMADFRPDRYWENSWKIEKRESHIELTPDQAVLEASSVIRYTGEEPAEDVRIIMSSPLTDNLLDKDGELATSYGTVKPGEVLEYNFRHEGSWREKTPIAVFAEKLVDDYTYNSYIRIAWKYGDQEYSLRFFDWSSDH